MRHRDCKCNADREQRSWQFKHSAVSVSAHTTSMSRRTSLRASWGCSWPTVGFPAGPSVSPIVAGESLLTGSVRMPSAFSGGRTPISRSFTARGQPARPLRPPGFWRFVAAQGELRSEHCGYNLARTGDPCGPWRVHRDTDCQQLRLLGRGRRLHHARGQLPAVLTRCGRPRSFMTIGRTARLRQAAGSGQRWGKQCVQRCTDVTPILV
jgi:hypothetical protein